MSIHLVHKLVPFAVVLLAACQITQREPTPGIADPGAVIEFTTYEGPGGYELAVPVRAHVTESDGKLVVEYDDDSIIDGSLIIELEVLEAPAAGSARELLASLTAQALGPSPIKAVSDMPLDAAMRSYDGPSGVACDHPRLLHAVFLADRRGYSLVLGSDAPGRCDASTIPQADPVVHSFRPHGSDVVPPS